MDSYHKVITEITRSVDYSALKNVAELIVAGNHVEQIEIRSKLGNKIVGAHTDYNGREKLISVLSKALVAS